MKKAFVFFLTFCLLLALSGCVTELTPPTSDPTAVTSTGTTATSTATAVSTVTASSTVETTLPTTAVNTTVTLPEVATTSTSKVFVPTGVLLTNPIYPTTGVAPQGVPQTCRLIDTESLPFPPYPGVSVPFDLVTHIVVHKNAEIPWSNGFDRYYVALEAGSDLFETVKDMMSRTEGTYMGPMYEWQQWSHHYYSVRISVYMDTADYELIEMGETEVPHGESYRYLVDCRISPEYGYFVKNGRAYSLDDEMCDAWRDLLNALSYPRDASDKKEDGFWS